ncbi:MAG: glutathione S-transferase family protein [Pelagimonas sp.]|jgi:glutathione S-transferase|nr:glutathione S-transferase family protein [Pelagimonas sp.]
MGYTLYGNTNTRAFRVVWMLEELGLEYTHVQDAPHGENVRRVSPLGKIPVLQDGEAIIPDSGAILTYLSDKHGRFTAPAGTPERGQQDAMTFRILDELDAVVWTAARHTFVLPKEDRIGEVKPTCAKEFGRNFEAICAEMKGDYLMGDELTVPDILLVHCSSWARMAKFPPPPESFKAYFNRIRSRPGFQAAAAKSAG